MSNTTITALSTASTIDGSTDWLAIDTASPNATNKINRNTLLGVTGQPADISTIQSLTNKTIGNTNTITLKDTLFTLQDDGDVTKQAKFQLSGITTATTRTYTMPNASTTVVGTDVAQTLTNKTITSPAITGGTIDNSTITVDSIAGHTSSTVVSIAGLQISAGVLNTNNSVVTANISDGAVTPAKLTSGTGSGWTWQTWTPTWSNLTVGNGTLESTYIQIGKTVFFKVKFTLGTTSAVGANPSLTFPITSINYNTTTRMVLGELFIVDSGTPYSGALVWLTTTTADLAVRNTAGTYATYAGVTSTVPFTWGTGDSFSALCFYEAA